MTFDTGIEESLAGVPDEAFDRSRFVRGVGLFDAALLLVGEALVCGKSSREIRSSELQASK